MIRIAQILGKMNGGGAEQVVMNYYQAIDREAVQFDFFLFKGSKYVPIDEIKSMGGGLYVLPTFRHPVRYVKTLRRLLKENGYELVHCHLSTLSFLPLLAAKQAGVRVRIVHNHSTSGGKRELLRNFAKLILKPFAKMYATDYFACSEYSSRWMYGTRAMIPLSEPECIGGQVRIMPNAIDTGKYAFSREKRGEIRGELKIPSKTLVFGHIGRFCPQKNQGFLIDIFKEIIARHKNARLVMAGSGPDADLIIARILAEGLSDKVILVGQRKDADKLYSAFDGFLLPSNYEGLPVVGVEAQCAGLYCLFSDKVTKEAKLTSAAQFLPLKSPADWACAALCCAELRNEGAADEIRGRGYDIKDAAKELCGYYIRRLTK